ncbi:hypothetical protein CDD82_3147 [Ophiocordyceps australis]|uniref:Terpene synthase n=1 Tax=Ophiocordyceps australis TaxID=1399860 RepID=A0A2C5ZGC4_9HYPO|nr:hypothetical protein CDD82_3147 [Ophiocordyceps australis]
MKSTTITSVCKPINPSRAPEFFSRYPVAISLNATKVTNALQDTIELASKPDSRERRRALIRHSNPDGNPFAICHCSAEPERLVILACIVDIMWIHDDVTEELNYNERALISLLRRAIDTEPSAGPRMIEMLREYLQNFDNRDDDFSRMADYMPYRIANCGYWMSSFFIRWGMGMTMSPEDYTSIQDYDVAMGNILGLTNDYYSWHVEKNQATDRIRNGVRVLMREHGVDADTARKLLLGIIIEEESKAARLKQERLTKPVSRDVALYFEAIELYVGGSCYWHAIAPRYRTFE